MRKGFHPDWNSYIFSTIKGEVKSFLTSSARSGLIFHIDGIRVDAVSSMLKLELLRKKEVGAERIWRRRQPGSNPVYQGSQTK